MLEILPREYNSPVSREQELGQEVLEHAPKEGYDLPNVVQGKSAGSGQCNGSVKFICVNYNTKVGLAENMSSSVLARLSWWWLSAHPQGIQDVGDFVSSVEHKRRCLTQIVAVCQSYNANQWAQNIWVIKNMHRQIQIKPSGFKNPRLLSTEETKSPTSWMPWG